MLGKFVLGASICIVFCLPGCSNPNADFLPVHFESGTTNIVQSDYWVLEGDLQELADFPEVKVDLVGHTNSEGSDSANLVLSYERADTIYHWLVTNGISSSRLTPRGVGESEPVGDNSTEDGRALNDRVEFEIK
jgi:OOP family OmpA-OmpF porin